MPEPGRSRAWALALLLVSCRAAAPDGRAKEALEVGRAALAEGTAAGLADAKASFEAALAAARAARREDLAVRAHEGLGQVGDRVGDQRARRTHWAAALAGAPTPEARLEAHLALADATESLGDHEAALEHAAAARALAAPGSVEAARVMLSEALVATHQDEHQRAIRGFSAATQIFEAKGRLDLAAVAWGAIASARARTGDWDASREAGARAVEVATASKDPVALADALSRQGLYAVEHQREYAKGIEIYDRAIALFEGAGHQYTLAYALDGSAAAMSTLDQREGTVERHLRALEIRRALGSARGEAQTLTSLGETLTRFGRYDEAAARLDEALKLHTRIGDLSMQVYTLFRRARVEESRGRFEAAVGFVQRAIEIDESLRVRLASKSKQSYFSARSRWRYDCFVNSSVQSELQDKRPGGVLRALEMSEATRARAFREVMAQAQTSTAGAGPLDEIAGEVAALERERRKAVVRDADPKAVEEIERRIADRLAEHERRALELRGRPRPIEVPLTQAELRTVGAEVLEPGDVLLEYYLGAGGSYVFVVTTTTVTVQALPPARVIEPAAHALHADLVARNLRPPDESRADLRARIAAADAALPDEVRALSKLVLDPVARWLADARRVVIVADGALHRIPFAALFVPGSERWLGLEVEVVESPSIAVVRALRRRPRAEAAGVLVLADPVFGVDDPRLPPNAGPAPEGEAFLARLPFTRREADAIAKRAGAQARARLDFEASRAAVLSGALAGHRVVHFATHGVLDPTHPELSALVLSRYDARGQPVDGALRLQDLDAVPLDAELVVLSGCETAIGPHIRGEGLISLTRGFLHAGAQQVLATLWKVEDRATSQMVEAFYGELLGQGRRPSEALLAARRATAARKSSKLPYFWAGFTLQGDWGRAP